MKTTKPDLKNKIIDISSNIFAKHGISKTTIEDIANGMNMGKSSLYYYFKNKEEIFKSVINREVDAFSQQIRKAVSESGSPQQKLKVFALKRMLYLKDLTNAYSALKDEYLTQYAFIQELRTDYDKKEVEHLRSILNEGISSGVFSIRDIDMTAQTFLTALKGFEYEWLVKNNNSINIESNIDALIEIFLNGINK